MEVYNSRSATYMLPNRRKHREGMLMEGRRGGKDNGYSRKEETCDTKEKLTIETHV